MNSAPESAEGRRHSHRVVRGLTMIAASAGLCLSSCCVEKESGVDIRDGVYEFLSTQGVDLETSDAIIEFEGDTTILTIEYESPEGRAIVRYELTTE